ncbi:MAG: type II secretion system F family protein [Armatimonadetes bacterium]|nr:type II secretion system F family protein [Armatimonadota bacterium]
MPTYHAEFRNAAGQRFTARLNAASLPALSFRLDAQGFTLDRVTQPRADPSLRGYWRRIPGIEVVTAFRRLSESVQGGVSLAAALGSQVRETRNPVLKAVLADLERAVGEGDTLSSACARYPRLFDGVTLRLLEVGEASGTLPVVLRQTAEYAERTLSLGSRIQTALLYPQVVGVVSLSVLIFAVLLIVPNMTTLFKELGVTQFPFALQSLIWFRGFGLPLLLALLGGAAVLAWCTLDRWDRPLPAALLRLRMGIPLVGPLYQEFALQRLARLMATLLESGVSLLEALRLAGQGCESPLLQAATWDAIPHVAAGESLAAALNHAALLPPTFCGQLAAAEAAGDLPGVLYRLSDWHQERTEYLASRVGALLEPVLAVVLGFLTFWVTMAIFGPMLGIIQQLANPPMG